MNFSESVSFLVIKNGQILIERRRHDKKCDPGLTAIPGGHCEVDESLEQTLNRELKEELGLKVLKSEYICTLIHKSEEIQKIHYFIVNEWSGTLENNEAEALLWIDLDKPHQIDIIADRVAIAEYLRHAS